ncbi:MAG: HAMP domain-containing protein [Proteobacteria bacterium]|nr:HAMP domain-containing protein [Pseudomonadota bacterium]
MRKLLPKSLGGQLILLLLGALTISHLLGFLIFSDERRLAMRSVHHMELLERTAAMVRVLETTSPETREEILRAVGSPHLRYWISAETALTDANAEDIELWLADSLGRMLAGGDRPPVRAHITDDGWPGEFMGFHDSVHQGMMSHHGGDEKSGDDDDHGSGPRGLRRSDSGMGLTLSVPLIDGQWLNVATGFRAPRSGWAWPTVVSMALAALAILLVATLTVRRITRPLKALSNAAERLGRGEEVEPLVETGPAELQRTTAAFNAMRERLTRFVRDRTAMLAAISHDLRTPLTSLRLHAELVEEGETRDKLLAILEEMQRMTEATLAFAREEAAREETRPVDLSALVDSLCDDLAELGMEVSFAGAERAPLSCRSVGLKRALRNLIENAAAYGHRARIALEETPDGFAIHIDDDGPGIPEADHERVFGPFVRLEESRSRETGGIGIGMAIARSIVRAHGGDITLLNRPEGGLRATVRLPRDSGAS